MSNPRAVAARILAALIEQRGSLPGHLHQHRSHPQIQLIQEFCYGCCRWFHFLQPLLERLLPRPMKARDHDVLALLLVGLYQIREMRIPDHAAIDQTVAAATQLRKPWARALLNGTLRNYIRQRNRLDSEAFRQGLAVTHSHPGWLLAAVQQQWPNAVEPILLGNNLRPPMTLRVNLAQQSREAYGAMLTAAALPFCRGSLAGSAVYLHKPAPIRDLPGFASGRASVQDEASQLVPSLLDLQPGQRVLDACCAPGGKLCHILESERSLGEVVALDSNPARLGRVRENLQRLGLVATVRLADATTPQEWWDSKPFDRILLDAPCSATGVIRRHPDVKLLRSEQSVKLLRRQQLRLLHALWQCLANEGLLLYATCSILAEENSELVANFLDSRQDAAPAGIAADWGVQCRFGRQLLPLHQDGPDGFFYCLLRKQQIS